jgi:hypothetical protein
VAAAVDDAFGVDVLGDPQVGAEGQGIEVGVEGLDGREAAFWGV